MQQLADVVRPALVPSSLVGVDPDDQMQIHHELDFFNPLQNSWSHARKQAFGSNTNNRINPSRSFGGLRLPESAVGRILIGVIIWHVVANSISVLWLAALLCVVTGPLSSALGTLIVKLCKWIRERPVG